MSLEETLLDQEKKDLDQDQSKENPKDIPTMQDKEDDYTEFLKSQTYDDDENVPQDVEVINFEVDY